MSGRFVRLGEADRPPISFSIDGRPAVGLDGDSLLVAVLNEIRHLRNSEFGHGARAGFCLMGACQECWLWAKDGERLRACTTPLEPGVWVLTQPPDDSWPNLA